MGDIAQSVLLPVEGVFATLGLTTPLARSIFGLTVGFLVWYIVRPSHTVDEQGRALPIPPFAKKDQPATWFGWFVYPVLFAFVFGFLI